MQAPLKLIIGINNARQCQYCVINTWIDDKTQTRKTYAM